MNSSSTVMGRKSLKLPSKVVRGGAASASTYGAVVVVELKTCECVYGLMFFDTLALRRL